MDGGIEAGDRDLGADAGYQHVAGTAVIDTDRHERVVAGEREPAAAGDFEPGLVLPADAGVREGSYDRDLRIRSGNAQ